MSTPSGKTVLITGAKVGIGKDVARQQALRPDNPRAVTIARSGNNTKRGLTPVQHSLRRPR